MTNHQSRGTTHLANSAIMDLVSEYEAYRAKTLNLIPSENMLSPQVLRALGSSMAGRYAGEPESYGGSKTFHEIWRQTENLAKKIFGCRFANVLPLSGHVAAMMCLDSLCTEKGENSIATLSSECGGYKGYNEGFMSSVMGYNVSYLPFNKESWNVDIDATSDMLETVRPSVVVLGATVFLFPPPTEKISKAVHSYGGKVIYDGSHVLGLIAGHQFGDPLSEGADVLLGSTHKTLFGPQGGLILTNDEQLASSQANRALYTFLDNFHLNRVAALGVALEEVKLHGESYAKKVVQNAQSLAAGLDQKGLSVKGKEKGFTQSHQVFLDYGNKGEVICQILEANGIVCDYRVRMGTNEVTRRGMGKREMLEIAEMVAKSISGTSRSKKTRTEVKKLLSRFRNIGYTLDP